VKPVVSTGQPVDLEALGLPSGLADRLRSGGSLTALIELAVQNIVEDPIYERAAARLFLLKLYREVWDRAPFDYASYFPGYIRTGVRLGVLDPRLLEFDLGRLGRGIRPERDLLLPYIGLYTLYDRYLVREPETGRVLEAPQALWLRVAMGLALNEAEGRREEWALRFYELISSLRYLPSTPTLFNSGTPHHQLAACYLYDVGDSLEQILEAAGEFGRLAKYAGGIGTSVAKIRAIGAPVKGINGRSGGLIPFLHMYDALIKSISQGGRRRGTLCAYIEPWHLEIEAFLDLKRNSGDPYLRTPSLNTALWVPDEFMRRVEADADWYLFDPLYAGELTDCYGAEFSARYRALIARAEAGGLPARAWRRVRARELYIKILAALMETGHPWLTFKDAANVRSMLKGAGVIHSGNLCTEVFLPTGPDEIAVCNLASVNLARHLKGNEVDWDRLGETVEVALRGLDNVIDLNLYPSPKAARSNLANRPVGLGLMGFAEALARLGLAYDEAGAAELADRVVEFVSHRAILASHRLARERGPFPNFGRSEWARGRVPLDTLADLGADRGVPVAVDRSAALDWGPVRAAVRAGMRNGTVLAVAPTATISLIAGTSSSLDPYYSNVFSRQTLSGKFLEFHPVLVEELKGLGLWARTREALVESQGDVRAIGWLPAEIRRRYPTAYQVSPEAYLEVAARAQKWVDLGISRSLFFDARQPSEIAHVYLEAWRRGLKATYYCFINPRMRAEPATVRVNKALRRPRWVVEAEAEACSLECESCQ
jgi:ribonucleoside-diphosphate reductase alpha chain